MPRSSMTALTSRIGTADLDGIMTSVPANEMSLEARWDVLVTNTPR
jgi:hypothetical protein